MDQKEIAKAFSAFEKEQGKNWVTPWMCFEAGANAMQPEMERLISSFTHDENELKVLLWQREKEIIELKERLRDGLGAAIIEIELGNKIITDLKKQVEELKLKKIALEIKL